MRNRSALTLTLTLTLTLAAMKVKADEVGDAPIYAVQNRELRLKHELNAGIGLLPINAFVKGVTLGGGYTYHFNDLVAWEIVQLGYAFGVDTNLKQQLINGNVTPTTGRTPVTMPMLMNACQKSMPVTPTARKWPKRSREFAAIPSAETPSA